jgi:hypothetical protein
LNVGIKKAMVFKDYGLTMVKKERLFVGFDHKEEALQRHPFSWAKYHYSKYIPFMIPLKCILVLPVRAHSVAACL